MKLNNNFLNSYTEIQEFDLRDSNHHSLKLWSEDDRDYDKHHSRDADEKQSLKDFDYHRHHYRLDRDSKREISLDPRDHKSRREQSSELSNDGRDVSRDHRELSYEPRDEREGSRERSKHREAKRDRTPSSSSPPPDIPPSPETHCLPHPTPSIPASSISLLWLSSANHHLHLPLAAEDLTSLSLLEEQEKQDELNHDMAPNDDASLIEETHKERNEAIFDYYSDLQECYSEVEESETMKRINLRSAAYAAMSTVADGVEIGKPGVESGHHRRLWVKDRSKAWWDECNQSDFPKSEFKSSYQIRSMTQLVCLSLTPSFLLPPFSPLHEPTKPPYQIRSMMQSVLGCCYELSRPLRPDPGPNSSSLPSRMMGPMLAEGRTCESHSRKYKGTCLGKSNCASVCQTEGFHGGHCRGFRRRCFCTKHC
ncbi:hypothetical protein C1H46_022829 [Malus baccata]|uniref:Knottins-like domain-containing protein n=1 Tax=Malus baccata TaxID=106549 RepID=A0A540LZ14_MALBA|nr:hypothetical protein C1H46_022829 [Malus baccata]